MDIKRKVKLALLLLFIIAAGLRFYHLDSAPNSLYIDEVDAGYQARSILETGKSYRGVFSPFYVLSNNDPRAPIPIYLATITTKVFFEPELQVRVPSAVLGTATVFLVLYLAYLLFENFWLAWTIGLITAISPWQLQFDRYFHENPSMLCILLIGLICFVIAIKKKRYHYLLFSAAAFGLSLYTYRPMGLFGPLFILILGILYRSELIKFGILKLLLAATLYAAIVVPFVYATTLAAPDVPRIAQLSITSYARTPHLIEDARRVDNTPVISSLFHNKPLSWFGAFMGNYVQTFSPQFLFVQGDDNRRHTIEGMGELYYLDFIGLFVGIYSLYTYRRQKSFFLIIGWIVLAGIPAAITIDGARHASRLFLLSVPLLMIVGLGWFTVVKNLLSFKRGKLYLAALLLIGLINIIYYLHLYYVHYPINSGQYFGYGFKQAMIKIHQVENQYQHIAMVSTKDPPMLYYLFWSYTDPRLIQSYGVDFSPQTIKNHPIDKYKVIEWPVELQEDTLYLVTQNEIREDLRNQPPPKGVKVIDVITYPDNAVDFYLITKAAETGVQ